MPAYLPVAEQLQILFATLKKPDGKLYTMQEVSRATGVSLPTLSQLRSGKITNPQLNTLRAICTFFQIPLRYFDTCTPSECLAILTAAPTDDANEADTGISLITTMAAGLSRAAQEDLLTVIQWAHAAEQQLMDGQDLPPIIRLKRRD